MSYGLIATLIVLAIVIGAITTKKCEAFLIAGSMVGAIVLWKQDFLTKWVSTLEGVISDEAYVILICGLFGSLVALLTASRGSFGFTKIVTKICNTERKTLFATFILGILIFVDDYLNVLSIGTAMKVKEIIYCIQKVNIITIFKIFFYAGFSITILQFTISMPFNPFSLQNFSSKISHKLSLYAECGSKTSSKI